MNSQARDIRHIIVVLIAVTPLAVTGALIWPDRSCPSPPRTAQVTESKVGCIIWSNPPVATLDPERYGIKISQDGPSVGYSYGGSDPVTCQLMSRP